jgi:hypothetical protein
MQTSRYRIFLTKNFLDVKFLLELTLYSVPNVVSV